MPPLEGDSRNPDRNRRALGIEFAVVLAVVWLPLLLSGIHYRGTVLSHSSWILFYRAVYEAGIICFLLYLLWRNQESLRHVAIRKTRATSELLWALPIYGSLWLAQRVIREWSGPAFELAPAGIFEGGFPTVFRASTTVLSAGFEELLIRGYFWNRIRRLAGKNGLALLGSAALFAAYHPYRPSALVYIFGYGVVFGLFRWQGRSLPRLVIAHTLFNWSIEFGLAG